MVDNIIEQENTTPTNDEYTGNIDLDNRDVVVNDDGSISTEQSITIEEDGNYINIPTVVDGKIVSDEDAVENYHNTGLHLGMYDNIDDALLSAENTHKRQEENYSDYIPDILEEINQNMDYGASRYKIEDNMRENNKTVPEYEGIYNSTIHDTGTALDGLDYDKVADSKQATPKDIWETTDIIAGVADGARAAFANTYDVGGRVANTILYDYCYLPWARAFSRIFLDREYEETPQLTEREMAGINPFGSKETGERESYAGDLAAGVSQFAAEATLLKGFKFPAVKSGVKIGNLVVKTEKGAKVLNTLGNIVYGFTAESIAFSENVSNLSEFINDTFGMTPTEFLMKKPDDPYLVKKLKNLGDSAFAGFVIGTSYKLAEKLLKQPAVKAGIKKGVEAIAKPVGSVVNPAAQKILNKVDPIGQIAKRELAEEAAEEAAKEVVEKTAKDVTEKTIKKGVEKVAKKVEQHPKTLTDEEIDAVLKQAKKRGMVDPDKLKEASKTVLENEARSIIELDKMAKRYKSKAEKLIEQFEAGELSEDNFQKEVFKLFDKAGESAAREKTALSMAGYAEGLASKSEAVKSINRLVKWVGENQDNIDSMKMARALGSLDDSAKMSAFIDVMNEVVRQGRGVDFVGKFTRIMQNTYLASISGRVQDAIGSLMNFSMQALDAQTAGVIGSTKQGLRNVAAKVGLATVKTETDRVFMNEAFNMISGMLELAKDTVIFNSKKVLGKVGKGELSPYKKARAQAIVSKQSRFGKKYGDITLFNSKAPIAELANKAFNHMGIWASEQVDDFIETFAYRGHLKRNVYHNVQVEGLKKGWDKETILKEQRKRFVKTLDHQFDPEELIDASKIGTAEGKMSASIRRSILDAEDTTFRSELKTGVAKWIYETINNDAVKSYFRLIYPFQKVGLKIAVDDYLGTRNPLTTPFSARFRRDFMAGGARQDKALAKLANGMLIQSALWDLYEEGKITGPVPANRNKARMYRDAGWMELSIFNQDTGKYTKSGSWMGPLEAPFVSIVSFLSAIDDIKDKVDERAGAEFTDHLLKLPAIFAESTLATSFMGDLIDNIDRGDTTGITSLANSLSTFGVPVIQEIRDLFGDGFKKTTLDGINAFKSKWFLGEEYEDLDIFGEPLWSDKRLLWIGPKTRRRKYDPLIEEMLYQKAYVQAPSSNISIEGGKIALNKAQVYEWQMIMGEIGTRKEMEKLINSFEYRHAVDYDNDKYGRASKRKLLVSKYNDMREKALNILLKRNVEVLQKQDEADYIKTQDIKDEKFQPYVPTM